MHTIELIIFPSMKMNGIEYIKCIFNDKIIGFYVAVRGGASFITLFNNTPMGQWSLLFPDRGLFSNTITTQILIEH